MKKSGRYKEGQVNRQAVLDYLIANPGAMAHEVIDFLGLTLVAGSGRLTKMFNLGEIRRETAFHKKVNAAGVLMNIRTNRYWANTKTTRTAEEVLSTMIDNIHQAKAKTRNPVKWKNGCYRNDDQDRPPLQNQGAVGSGRSRIYASSSSHMFNY